MRFDKVYPMELAHYEFEECLQTFYDLYSGKTPVYINKSQEQTVITNIIISTNSSRDDVTNTNIINNVIAYPSESEIRAQNKYNINVLRLSINDAYKIQLSRYE